MIVFRPLHTPPIRPRQTGVDSTKWIEIEPPVYMLGVDADDANDKAHDLVTVLTLNAELWAERTLDEKGFKDTWQSLYWRWFGPPNQAHDCKSQVARL